MWCSICAPGGTACNSWLEMQPPGTPKRGPSSHVRSEQTADVWQQVPQTNTHPLAHQVTLTACTRTRTSKHRVRSKPQSPEFPRSRWQPQACPACRYRALGGGACAHLNRASQQSRCNKLALPVRPDPRSYLQVVPQQRGPPSHCKHSRQEKHKSHLRRAANDLLSPRQPGRLQTVSASPLQRPGCLVEARQGPAAFEPLSLREGCPAAALQLRGPSAVHSASGSPARGEAAVPGGVRVAYCLTAWCP